MDRRNALRLLALTPAAAMTLRELAHATDGFPSTPAMPVLFLGHGSPMNAIEDNPFSREWQEIGRGLPR
ncbi:MAG TPA: 4,5-DOPA dioxygenase extradiol, partial [Flavobacteriales bacterium]|nr:4,5-DOPA dioxygenase extradiol [Flavobacteriales bacterium]